MVQLFNHIFEPVEICFYVSLIFIVIYYFLYRRKNEYEFVGIGEEDLVLLRKKYKRFYNKRENMCRRILETMFHAPFPTIRPPFLRYPLTGRNLEIDCYNPDLKLGLEYQGEQHYKYMPRVFHNSEEDFIGQQNRDNFKRHRCAQLGITVIEVPYNIPDKELRSYIRAELYKKNIRPYF